MNRLSLSLNLETGSQFVGSQFVCTRICVVAGGTMGWLSCVTCVNFSGPWVLPLIGSALLSSLQVGPLQFCLFDRPSVCAALVACL